MLQSGTGIILQKIQVHTYIGMYLKSHTKNRRYFMAGWGITSDSQIRAQAAYDKKNTVRLSLKLNIRTDEDIIRWIRSQKSMQGTIKRLIREEIARINPTTS